MSRRTKLKFLHARAPEYADPDCQELLESYYDGDVDAFVEEAARDDNTEPKRLVLQPKHWVTISPTERQRIYRHLQQRIDMRMAQQRLEHQLESQQKREPVPASKSPSDALALVFGPRTMVRVFEPLLADLDHDWTAACEAEANRARLVFIKARWYLHIVLAATAFVVVRLLRSIWKFASK